MRRSTSVTRNGMLRMFLSICCSLVMYQLHAAHARGRSVARLGKRNRPRDRCSPSLRRICARLDKRDRVDEAAQRFVEETWDSRTRCELPKCSLNTELLIASTKYGVCVEGSQGTYQFGVTEGSHGSGRPDPDAAFFSKQQDPARAGRRYAPWAADFKPNSTHSSATHALAMTATEQPRGSQPAPRGSGCSRHSSTRWSRRT